MNRERAAGRPLGLYIHTPFCSGKCAYCDFYSYKQPDPAVYARYAGALRRHMEAFSPDMGGYTADSVYFGGGTPTVMGARLLSGLLKEAGTCFSVSGDAEITVEANPGDLHVEPGDGRAEAALSLLREASFNRISFGVQSCHDDELSLLGRRHSFAQAAQAVRLAKAAGFDNLSLDLMYALPGQRMAAWQDSVRRVLDLAPQHISCYALKLSESSPLYGLSDRIPDDEEQLAMYLWLVEYLKDHGFAQYEISNFARPGFRSRHNQKYWDLSDYLGLGPSAHSYLHGERFSWAPDAERYIREAPDIEPDEHARIGPGESLREYLMLRLRTSDGLDADELTGRYGVPFEPFRRRLERFEKAGLGGHEGRRWFLSPRGFFVSNAVIVELWRAADDLSAHDGESVHFDG